jgi:hypothetical protein
MTLQQLLDQLNNLVKNGCDPNTPVVNTDDRGIWLWTYNPIIGPIRTSGKKKYICIDTGGEEKKVARSNGTHYDDV